MKPTEQVKKKKTKIILIKQFLLLFFKVDFLIECATNITNLALLYEGWTSWV